MPFFFYTYKEIAHRLSNTFSHCSLSATTKIDIRGLSKDIILQILPINPERSSEDKGEIVRYTYLIWLVGFGQPLDQIIQRKLNVSIFGRNLEKLLIHFIVAIWLSRKYELPVPGGLVPAFSSKLGDFNHA